MIRYFKHHQIDKIKWDQCIFNSQNRLVYALSWYLDIVTPEWEALIEDDYLSVMPLPAKKKYGISYLSQPFYLQQLGIFSAVPVNEEKIRLFIKKIPLKFVKRDFNLNFGNNVNAKGISLRHNYELNLNRSYSDIYGKYNVDYNARKLKLAKENNLLVSANDSGDTFIAAYRNLGNIIVKEDVIKQLKRIIDIGLAQNIGELYIVRNVNNEIIAGAFFLIHFNRIIYLVSFSSEEGKKVSAMFLLVDHIIQKYAGKEIILDFEGSMIPGIAKFMKGWGAELTEYPRYCKSFF